MPTGTSLPRTFLMVPDSPLDGPELEAYRAQLAAFPTYHDAVDDVYVLFGSAEEQRETVALYARQTHPTFDVETFVQIRSDRLLVHPGGSGNAYLRQFVEWANARRPHRLYRGQVEQTIDELLPRGPQADG